MPGLFSLGLVAAEPSGDRLGVGVVRELRTRFDNVKLIGIGGPQLESSGLQSICNIDQLSMMGFEEIRSKLPNAIKVRKNLKRILKENPPDVFLGIDSPDFNLGLEKSMRNAGIPVIHLVSPTVWAWRQYRIRKIKKAVDKMLVLFPFEKDYYESKKIPVTYVGHPAASETKNLTKIKSRQDLGISIDASVMAVLPGSRESEVRKLSQTFATTINKLSVYYPNLKFVLPFVNQITKELFFNLATDLSDHDDRLIILDGKSRIALACSDVALVASGTAALEAALVECPMVVSYRVSNLTYQVARRLASTHLVSMPNHLMKHPLVPELIQTDVTVDNLYNAVKRILDNNEVKDNMIRSFIDIKNDLTMNTNKIIVDEIIKIGKRDGA